MERRRFEVHGKKGMKIGDRAYLRFDMLNDQGEIISAGTIGSIESFENGVPKIYLGAKHGSKAAAPHYLVIIDVPDGTPLPDDGTLVEIEDVLATLAALTWDLHCAKQRLQMALRQAVSYGRS
jgi:hypothetical protein